MSADSVERKWAAVVEADRGRMAGAELAGGVVGIGHAAAALELRTELRDAPRKVASAAVEALPEVVTLLPGEAVATWIDLAISLNEQSGAASIKFCKESPLILRAMETVVAGPALAMALELAEQDANVSLEGFRQASGVAAAAGVEALPLWAQIGADLAKLDYVLGIEYLRRGPEILKVLAPEVIDLAHPDAPAPAPAMVGAGGAPLAGPPLAMMDRFDKWYRGGMEVLAYNPDAARAYFAVETRKALDAIEEAASGVGLRSVVRILKLFAEGLSGHPVTIRPLEEGEAPIQSKASADGSPIFLPARMRRYPTKEDNLRVYKVLTAHEAGHLEYGTYDLKLSRLADLATQAGLRYGRAAASSLASLEDLFQLYPQPLLICDLWMMAEDARIEARLKAEDPGLRRDMDAVAREEVARRSLTHGMSVRELGVALLLQMSASGPDVVRVL